MRILVYHCGALGDFICILPFLALLKKKEACHITLLGKPEFGVLAQANGQIDEIIDADSSLNIAFFSLNPCPDKISSFFSSFDIMYLFTDDNSPLCNNARSFSSAEIRNCSPLPACNEPVSLYYCRQFSVLTLADHDCIPDLSHAINFLGKTGFDTVSFTSNSPVAALHPGSGSPLKNWPIDSFVNVADRLRTNGYVVVWLSGPAESMYQFPDKDLHFRNLSLPQCALFLSKCAVYCGNDSGITHLAAAVGCTTVAIFGPSNPAIWAPRGKNRVHIIHHREPCSPCHLQSMPHCSRFCLHNIGVDEVVQAIMYPKILFEKTQ